MGGMGSGPVYSRKTTVEECRVLDIGDLKREGALEPGVCGSISWADGEREEGASIGWQYTEGTLRLLYTVTRDGEPKDYDYTSPIEWTECNFGGKRPWLCCPACGRRGTKLYLPPGGGQFLCRECWDLTYTSTQVRRKFLEETGLKIDRIKKKLGKPDGSPWDPVPKKPKGMQWKTYQKLSAEIAQLQDQLAGELKQVTEKTFPDLG